MYKQLVLVLLVCLAVSQLCPSKVLTKCEDDVKKGKIKLIQLTDNVKKLLKKRVMTNKLMSTVLSTSSVPKRIAGPAFVTSPRRKAGRSRDAISS
jgi:hypothetical protein